MATEEPLLNDVERQSAIWRKIKAHLEARLVLMRERNDRSQGEAKTERLRGRIAEIKYIVALDKPAPHAEADDSPG